MNLIDESRSPFNKHGHIDGETCRVAMTVHQVIELQNKEGDVYSYTYDIEADEMGLDPWRLVDSINPFTNEPKAELWFDNGGSKVVLTGSILYVQQHKKAKDVIKLAEVVGRNFVLGSCSAEDVIKAISSQTDPVAAAYLALRIVSGMPDMAELAIRQALLRRIAK